MGEDADGRCGLLYQHEPRRNEGGGLQRGQPFPGRAVKPKLPYMQEEHKPLNCNI